MLKVVNSIDKEKWSEFVRDHPQGNIFQTPEMAEVYSSTKGYKPLQTALERDGEIQALILASVIKETSIMSSFSTRSVITGGPLLSEELPQDEIIRFIEEYNKAASKHALFTQIRTLSDTFDSAQHFLT
jgi:lipid II:glycine glycyltransferase (peptidoglycan interpeptide bridge formation enzyme)